MFWPVWRVLFLTCVLLAMSGASWLPLIKTSGASYDPATIAWVNAVVANGGTVSSTREGQIDLFIKCEKSANTTVLTGTLWSNMDIQYVLAGENSIQARTSLNNPTSFLAVNHSAMFTPNSGFTGDGAAAYVDLSYNPATQAIKLSQNSASLGVYWATAPAEFGGSGNGGASGNLFIVPNYFAATSQWGINDASQQVNLPTSQPAPAGFYVVARTGASSSGAFGYYNVGSPNAGTQASTGISSWDLTVLAVQNAPASFGNYDTATIGLAFAGAGFSTTDDTNLNSCVSDLAMAIGF